MVGFALLTQVVAKPLNLAQSHVLYTLMASGSVRNRYTNPYDGHAQHNEKIMTASFQHISVLLNESIEGLAIKPNGIYIDGTFGRGGHSRTILAQLGPEGRL